MDAKKEGRGKIPPPLKTSSLLPTEIRYLMQK